MRSRFESSIKTAAFLAAGLAAGFAIASFMRPDRAALRTTDGSDAGLLAGRIAALEQSLLREAARREALAGEVASLRTALDAVEAVDGSAAGDGTALGGSARIAERGDDAADAGDSNAEAAAASGGGRSRGLRFVRDAEGWRAERLVDAGFSPDRAAWIETRIEELRMRALEEQYRAARGGEELDPRVVVPAAAALRAELGDDDYERYLRAFGRPTSIGVRSVLASSPAEQAGLLPGDEVVGYAGQRVFDVGDLNRLTLEGQPGEAVALDVVRDGQTIQLYVPRGPIGIVGGGRFGPRP